MVKTKCFSILVCALALSSLTAQAQSQFRLTFRGFCVETNSAGVMVNRPMTERTLLAEFARDAGLDPRGLALVYRQRSGGDMGDTIQVVNATNGTFVAVLFGFYFGEDFGRTALTNANGQMVYRLDYLYTRQNSHSLGSALVFARFFGEPGRRDKAIYSGQMQWVVTPERNRGTRICRGNFITGRVVPVTP